jgi:hypothetical protein
VGLNKAKREGRPAGLALAGVIVGIVAIVVGVMVVILLIAVSGSS